MATDFVIELQGARDPSNIDVFASDSLTLDLSGYKQSQALTQTTRTLRRLGRGARADGPGGEFLDPKITADLVTELLKVRNSGDQLGAVCISGYSKGAVYALRLAQEMNEKGLPIRYIGLSDLPLFPFDYNPRIPSFPDMKPINTPSVVPNAAINFPPRVFSPPPRVEPVAITARRKLNFFQVAGNGAKVQRNPRGGIPWWWSSNMFGQEIHGELEGWENFPLNVSPRPDDNENHQNGDDEGLKRASKDINELLALVPFEGS